MTFNVSEFISGKIKERARNRALWLYAATEWHRLYFDYVPFNTGALANTIRIKATNRGASIVHTVPYAHRLYNGTGYRFRRDLHPMAGAKWDQRARTRLPQLEASVSNFIKAVT